MRADRKSAQPSSRTEAAKKSSNLGPLASKSRGRPRGETSVTTKKKLLRCAREVFAEYGYHGGTIAEIVRRAEVSTPVLYHHFGSKSGLFRAAIDESSEILLETRNAALIDAVTLREKLEVLLEAAIRTHTSDPQLARFLLSARVEAARDPELVVRTEFTQYSSANVEVFRALAVESGLSSEKADAVAHVCGTIFGGLSVIAVSSPLDYDTAVKSLLLLLDSELFNS